MHTLRLLWAANNETTLQRRQTRENRRKMVQIVEMEELELVQRFRLDKQSFWRLCDDLRRLTSLKGTREISLEIKVCNSNLKITNVNPKFGGATHDSFIWASSRMETFMRELHQNGEQVWLLEANLPPPSIMEVEEDDAQPDNASDSVGAASDQSELLQGRAVLNNLLSRL
ncbi:unnamed protein product [Parnassius apollo]|uniref:(apollo) hypothetical protein n=1 Tax=Parnassius apollo TaxID=110799 RepID=A0A8S3XAJ1_PARAO|nr:unnamed protein product [Parnassius apollo]